MEDDRVKRKFEINLIPLFKEFIYGKQIWKSEEIKKNFAKLVFGLMEDDTLKHTFPLYCIGLIKTFVYGEYPVTNEETKKNSRFLATLVKL